MQSSPIEVFYSCAEEDAPLLEQLERHLSLLRREGLISTWHPRRIVAGHRWQEEVDHHLETASLIVLLISSDFLASDYCYGTEMRRALARHKTHDAIVLPVLLRPCDWKAAPFAHLRALPTRDKPITQWQDRDEAWTDVVSGIRHLLHEQFVDLSNAQDTTPIGRKPVPGAKSIHQPYASLTEGLIGLTGSPLTGVEHFLREYLGTPEKPAPFGGRQKQLAELDCWLETPGQSYALMVAEAGRGKSALLAHWVAKVASEQRANVVLVPISIRFNTALKNTAISLLGARLHHLLGGRADPPNNAEIWLAEIEMYLHEDRPIGQPLLIVLDGADEAAGWTIGRDLSFPPELGRGIKVLVSARAMADCDTSGWMRRLKWQGVGVPLELPRLDQTGVADVLLSMGDPLAQLVTQVDMIKELHRLSEGDPLLVRLYVEALRDTNERAAFLTPEDLEKLKPGLQAYFNRWWDDQEWQWKQQGRNGESEQEDIMDFFKVCAIALGPLLRDEITDIAKDRLNSGWRLRAAATEAGRFIIGDGQTQGYTFSHPRLAAYFREEQMTEGERSAWVQQFLNFGQRTLAALESGEIDPQRASPYAVRYYSTHLEQAGASLDKFDGLICEKWQRAWEAREGSYDGFLNDLIRAWKQAEASGSQAQNTQERSRAIDRQCRYALIMTSIRSLAATVPPALLVALVDKGIWTSIRGLAYAQQIPHESSRVQALIGLVPHLSEAVLREAVQLVCMVVSEDERAKVLAKLLSRLGELGCGEEALGRVQAVVNKEHQAEVLAELAPYLSEPLLQKAVKIADDIPNEHERAEALAKLAPHLSELQREEMLQKAMGMARTITDEKRRARVLAELAPHLSEPLLQEAVGIAHTIADEERQAEVLAELAPRLGKMGCGEMALKMACMITDGYRQARALTELALYLSKPLREWVLQEAMGMARMIANEERRVAALVLPVPYLWEPLQGSIQQGVVGIARTIADGYRQAEVLAKLAPHLPAPLLQEAVEIAYDMPNEHERAEALAKLAPHLPELQREEMVQEAMGMARTITDEKRRARVLAELAPHLSEPLLQEAVGIAHTIADEERQAEVLAELAPHLSEPLLQEAVEMVCKIYDEQEQAEVLVKLAPHLSESLLQEVVKIFYTMINKYSKAEALAELVPYLSEPLRGEVLQEAVGMAHMIINEKRRAELLVKLAPHLSEPLLQEAVNMARDMTDINRRAEVRAELVPHLGKVGYGEIALEMVDTIRYTIDYDYRRAEALAKLAPYLPESLQEEVLQKAVRINRQVTDDYRRAEALAELVPYLSEPLRGEVLQEAVGMAMIASEYRRAGLLAKLAPYLPEPLLQEAVNMARKIANEYRKAGVLANLASYLLEPLRGKVLQEAVEVIRQVPDGYRKAEALAELTPYLPEPLREKVLQEMIEVVRKITDEYGQAQMLMELASYVKQLPVTKLYSLWCEILRLVASRTRSDLLSYIQAFAPAITILGGKEALFVIAQAIIEVGKWFP